MVPSIKLIFNYLFNDSLINRLFFGPRNGRLDPGPGVGAPAPAPIFGPGPGPWAQAHGPWARAHGPKK